MTGSTKAHHDLEGKVAEIKNKSQALDFNSGYQANVGIISSLLGKGDCIFSDRLNHASVVDGIILSGAKLFRFKHNDAEHLEGLLKKERDKYKNALVVTETVFSMEGDIAPLKEITDLKDKYDFLFMVDEAHATGVFGENGSGIAFRAGVSEKIDIIMGTFSKALGSFGAYAAVDAGMKEYLVNRCRSFIYSTALPGAVIAANLTAVDLVQKEPVRRKTLLENAKYLRDILKNKGFRVIGESQIIPVIIGENAETVKMAECLKKEGFWVMPVRPPTVPAKEARIRISLTYDHSKEVLDRFAKALGKI